MTEPGPRPGASRGRRSELEVLRVLYTWNSQVRKRYLETLLRLPPEERLRDRGASYPSLQEVYVHVLEALRFWLVAVPQDRVSGLEELRGRDLDPEALRALEQEIDRQVLAYVGGLRESDLENPLLCHETTPEGVVEHRFPVTDVLWHMVEEELQHRGELNALLWQMDVEPPLGKVEDWHRAELEAGGPKGG